MITPQYMFKALGFAGFAYPQEKDNFKELGWIQPVEIVSCSHIVFWSLNDGRI